MKYLMSLLIVATLFSACKKDDPEEQAKTDEDIIKTYIADNNLTATRTSSGLYYVVDEAGTGAQPGSTSTVTVRYRGYFTNGGVFDQSSNAGATFGLQSVIEGWQEGIPLYKEGGSGILLIPSALAYGTQGTSGIPANSVILFDIELLDVQ